MNAFSYFAQYPAMWKVKTIMWDTLYANIMIIPVLFNIRSYVPNLLPLLKISLDDWLCLAKHQGLSL